MYIELQRTVVDKPERSSKKGLTVKIPIYVSAE
jgi:hypothetical protein